MARGRIKKASTHIDMTPMCDVAFLLLTFFILVGKFKPSEAITVAPPASVSNKVAPESNFFMVTIDKENKAFISMDASIRENVINQLGQDRNISFNDADVQAFKNAEFVGVPLAQLKQFDLMSSDDQKKVALPGIPYDSAHNELQAWITAAVQAAIGTNLQWLIKADGDAKYQSFKAAIDAFKKNDIYKYNLITNSMEVPKGSELWKKNMEKILEGGRLNAPTK